MRGKCFRTTEMFQIELWLANRAFHFRIVFNTCPKFIHIYIFKTFRYGLRVRQNIQP